MPLIGFTMFKEKLLDGSKRQTIRVLRKRPIKVDDVLYLYWKLRTKQCEFIRKETCTETFFVEFMFDENFLNSGPSFRVDHYKVPNDLGFITFTHWQCEELAHKDGFSSMLEMLRALKKKHGDFNNKVFQVIRW